MKPILITLFCIFSLLGVSNNPRTINDFNSDWKFFLGDEPNAISTNFDDSNWQDINLPHDWSIEQSYTSENTAGSTGFLPTGIGWYRKSFKIDADFKNQLISIEFDGVFSNAEVWINGKYLGKRPYGYSWFGYDLTPHLFFDKENLIVVKADNAQFANSRWYTGSGIYRNVRLVSTNKLFIPRYGAWVETPDISTKKAKVEFTTVLCNQLKTKKKAEIEITIFDADKNQVSQVAKKVNITQKDTIKLQATVKNPKLWSIENTNQYKAKITIKSDKEIKDEYCINFGIREIKFTPDNGFFLNDENIELKGVCIHHDAGAVGAVFIRDVWKRRLQKLKDIGVNAIRSSHNPMDPGLLDLCDELGFLVINEAFDEWRKNKNKWITSRFAHDMRPELVVGYGDIYEEWAERDIKDMVRSSRNHPSIIMWSMGNEIEWTYSYYYKIEKSNQGLGNAVLSEETNDGKDELKETAEELQRWIKEIDQTRFVTTGGVLPRAGNITGYFDVPDVIGYNYRAVNYDEDHANYPNRIMYGSENWGTYQEWKDAVDRDFVAGVFLWTGIAYLGESGPFPWKGLEISLLDFAGFETPRGHFFKTLWNDEPYTYAATKHAKKSDWELIDGEWKNTKDPDWLDKWLFEDVDPTWNYKKGDEVVVQVYSNSPEVELFVNNKSYGTQKPDNFPDHIVKFKVPYADGEVKAVGLKEGKPESKYALKTAKWLKKLELVVDKTKMKANGNDVAHIEAYLKAANGQTIADKKMQIVFEVKGEGVNISVDNGWDRNVQKHQSNQIVTHNGQALMLVQSTKKAGKIKIKARVGNLESEVIEIVTE